MMRIELFERKLLEPGGFFSYLFRALVRVKGATLVDGERPLPRMTSPREHASAWAKFDGHLVFFDMSDHIFLYDLDALRRCDLYFKTNLHRPLMERILAGAAAENLGDRIVPLFSLAGRLEFYRSNALVRFGRELIFRRSCDVCHIAGVYKNLVQEGEISPFRDSGTIGNPGRLHFWIRYHTQEALKEAGISGCYRLTSRGCREIEDNVLVFPNISQRRFMHRMLSSSMTVVNTLPHALLPWKASESLALGRPLLLERRPLTEIPEHFRLVEGEHYLELMPGHGSFDPEADPDDIRSYRLLQKPDLAALQERARWLADVLRDRERMDHMIEQCRRYSREVLSPQSVADYVCDRVRERVG